MIEETNPVMNRAGFFEVQISDQTSTVVDLLLHIDRAQVFLLADLVVDNINRDITLQPGHGVIIGDMLGLIEGTHFLQSFVLNVVGDVITLDTPPVFNYTVAGSIITIQDTNMAVDGSITPQVFGLHPAPNVAFDIVRIIFFIADGTAMDYGKFGGIDPLINGCAIRKVDDELTANMFNYKTNGELELRNYDSRYSQKAVPPQYSFTSRRTWGGASKNGVVVRLDGADGEALENLIQDDLTDLDAFYIVAQGHVVVFD